MADLTKRHLSLRLENVTPPRRSSPNCWTALVELAAKWQYAVPNVDRAWFNHAIRYEGATDGLQICEEEGTLDFRLHDDSYAMGRFEQKLLRYYRLQLERVYYDDVSGFLEAIQAALRRGTLVGAPLDLCFTPGYTVRSTHFVAPIGLDYERRTLTVIDWINGEFEITFENYAEYFARFAPRKNGVYLLYCNQANLPPPLPLERSELRHDLEVTLGNLRSTDPALGISALGRASHDLETNIERLERPYELPDAYKVRHDLYSLKTHCWGWREMKLLDDPLLERFERGLQSAMRSWLLIGSIATDAVATGSISDFRNVGPVMRQIIADEEVVANLLEEVWRALKG
jgi:hypothetical protein